MKTTVLIFSLIICTLARGQDVVRYPLDFSDVFVVRAEIGEVVDSAHCACFKKEKCCLYKIRIKEVLYCPTNTFSDSAHLYAIRYISIRCTEITAIQLNTPLLITAMPSDNYQYLSFSKVLNISDSQQYSFYHPYAYLSGIVKCKGKKKGFKILKSPYTNR